MLTQFKTALLPLHFANTTLLEYPSMDPCIMIPQCDKCDKEFSHWNKHFLWVVTMSHPSAVILETNLIKALKIRDLWTRISNLLICKAINIWPALQLWRSKYYNIKESSSSAFKVKNPKICCNWNSVACWWIVHCKTPYIFEISFHEKLTPRNLSRISAGMLNLSLP